MTIAGPLHPRPRAARARRRPRRPRRPPGACRPCRRWWQATSRTAAAGRCVTASATASTSGWSTSTSSPCSPGTSSPSRASKPPTTSATPGLPIKANVENYLSLHGIHLGAGGRVVMLANARVLGHVFDPLSVFWCFDGPGALVCIVAEVHNTYGERHVYLLRPDAVRGRPHEEGVLRLTVLRRHRGLRAALHSPPRPGRRHGAAAPGRGGGVQRDLPRASRSCRPRGPGPSPGAQPVDATTGLHPDPAARRLAVAAPPARRPPSAPSPSGRGLT